MDFFLYLDPPTATAQEKQVRIVHGKPLFYDPAPVKEARSRLITHLLPNRPGKPLDGPISLSTVWLTRCGFWYDDAQVVRESVEKRWSDEPAGIFIVVEQLEAPA